MWNYEEKGPDYEEDDYQGVCQWSLWTQQIVDLSFLVLSYLIDDIIIIDRRSSKMKGKKCFMLMEVIA